MKDNISTKQLNTLTPIELKALRLEIIDELDAFLKNGGRSEPLLMGEMNVFLDQLKNIVDLENTDEARTQLERILSHKSDREFVSIAGYRQYKRIRNLIIGIWCAVWGSFSLASTALFVMNHMDFLTYILFIILLLLIATMPLCHDRKWKNGDNWCGIKNDLRN